MTGRVSLLLGTIAAFVLGNAICMFLLSTANENGNTSLAQSVIKFRDIYNLTVAAIFVLAIVLIILNRGSSDSGSSDK